MLSLLSGVRPFELSSEPNLVGATPPEVDPDRTSWTPSQTGRWAPLTGRAHLDQHLAHYEIVSRIGAGGMGEVYRARDLRLGREVAIKVMHEGLSPQPDRLRRFEREARAAAALNHPNIATIYEVGDHEGTRFISMELVEGQTLRDRLEQGALPVKDLLRLATQIAGGLAKAHAAGIVHRDLKPGNLMVTDDGLAKILDFGLVKLLTHASDPSSEITGEGSVLGTVEYMSPEQALARPVDHRSDQFSFGSILYEMATGRRPFQKDAAAQTLVAIIQTKLEPARQVNPDTPVELSAIVERCLAKDPEERYASTAELAQELAHVPAVAASAPPRRPKRWLPAAGLMTLAGVAIVVLLWSTTRPGAPDARETLLQVVPLTSYPGREAEPSFSPDGSQVAFSWDGESQDNRDIYVKVIGSEQPLRLTSDPALDGSPAWYERVAFTSARSGGLEIWVADSQGANLLRLTSLGKAGSVGSPRWSPDGRSIAFDFLAEGDTGADVLVVSASGGPPRRVTTAPSPDTRPSWSRDGRWIYFASHRSGQWQVWKVPSEGEEEASARQVTRGGGYSSIESLDGAHLYFGRRRSVPEDPRNAIWRIPVEGGDEEVVIESVLSSDTNWDLTAQGIYFVDRHETSTAGEHWVVTLLDLDRRQSREVMRLRYPPRLAGPALSVSSDGRWILTSQLQEESDLMLVENFH